MARNDFERAISTDYFNRICKPFEIEGMEAAFDGDTEAALSLAISLNNDVRGLMAVAMWRAKVPREAFRAYFSSVWGHDHRYVTRAAVTRRRLAYMFRYAAFPIPDEVPDVIRVWRGTSKLNLDEAQQGYSWTNDRDIACWFAMRFADINGSPLVLAADVSRADIALFTNDRQESEVLLIKPPRAVWIDGDERDWLTGYERHESSMRPVKLPEVVA